MGKCRENTKFLKGRQFSLCLPSGTAVGVNVRERTDGEPGSVVEFKRKDGKSFEHGEVKNFINGKITEFRRNAFDIFDNNSWALWRKNNVKFSHAWFDSVEIGAKAILNAKEIRAPQTDKPATPEALVFQKRIAQAILQRVEDGRKALKDGQTAEGFGKEIIQFFAKLLSEPDRLRGQKITQAAKKGGEAKGQLGENERADWQRRAGEIWSKHPDWTLRSVANQIDREERLSSADKFAYESRLETIRRVISRPKGKDDNET